MKSLTVCPFAWLLLSLVCIGLSDSPTGADEAAGIKNILDNGSLEGDLDPATSLPAGWVVTQKPESDYKVEVVDGGRTGKKCLRISGDGKNVQIALKHLALSPEKRSVISGFIKIVGGDGAVALSHRYEDANGRGLGTVSMGGFKGPQADWMQTASIEHPEFAPQIADASFIIGANGKIDALVDDLEVFTLDVTQGDLLWAAGDFESHYNRVLPQVHKTAASAGEKVEISPDDKQPANGRYALRMKANADWSTTALWPVRYDAGKVYTLTGKVRVNSGRASLRIDYYKGDNRTDLLGSSTIDAVDSKDWQNVSVDTRDNKYAAATHITATAVCHGDTEAFFDQLVLLAK